MRQSCCRSVLRSKETTKPSLAAAPRPARMKGGEGWGAGAAWVTPAAAWVTPAGVSPSPASATSQSTQVVWRTEPLAAKSPATVHSQERRGGKGGAGLQCSDLPFEDPQTDISDLDFPPAQACSNLACLHLYKNRWCALPKPSRLFLPSGKRLFLLSTNRQCVHPEVTSSRRLP